MPLTSFHHLVLAGGGHSHALVLLDWCMHPQRRPAGLITLVNRQSSTLYSGMIPGLIAGHYKRSDVAIDLRRLCDRAGVALVIAEITGVDVKQQQLQLRNRPALSFSQLSINVGGDTRPGPLLAIKPLEPALDTLNNGHDPSSTPFQLLGSGLAAMEVALALRQRWPKRRLQLLHRPETAPSQLLSSLNQVTIEALPNTALNPSGPGLRCTGSQAPEWLHSSGLPCCPESGRVRTHTSLQVLGHPAIFAAGDCAVVADKPRPPSGVWAVRAAATLAHNLRAWSQGDPLRHWRPQRRVLQLLGGVHPEGYPHAWALWGGMQIGPHPWIWRWKQRIDRQFMARFDQAPAMSSGPMDCRGCAAKLPAAPLEAALEAAGLKALGSSPEDAASLGNDWLQSVDGFPALISDPWLNGRLTALHASSDLWACGSSVDSAMAVITLPKTASALQQELLSQTLSGLRSAFEPQGARLIGGHTLEARAEAPTPLSLGLQVSLTVNGKRPAHPWTKGGLQPGDHLLLSRPLGTGVLFAAAMAGAAQPEDLDHALAQMGTSQHPIVEQLQELINLEAKTKAKAQPSCTDVTGFGLLGHLGEMLQASSQSLQVVLDGSAIPALPGALKLLKEKYASSLAPANRRAWSLLDPSQDHPAKVSLARAGRGVDPEDQQAMLELLVDPQTCGPLLLSCSGAMADALLQANNTPWHRIGVVSASRADAADASAAIPLQALGPAANPGPTDP